jgi:4-hydroxybenzoate polyprenyltransferase
VSDIEPPTGSVKQNNSYDAFLRIVRFREYGPYYLISALACGFVAKFPVNSSIIPVLIFVAASSIFGFVINDIADAELDGKAGKLRNPIASDDLSVSAAWKLALIFLGAATLSLYPLDRLGKLLGLLIIALFSGYSFGLRAKVRPGVDVICHASWNALYGVMAYSVYRPLDLIGVQLSSLLFLSSMMMELLNEIRDHDSEKDIIRTTATTIGKRGALKLCILILLLILTLFVSLTLTGGLPWILLIFSPSIIFLVTPIVNALRSEQNEQSLLPTLVSRGAMIVILIFIAYLTIKVLGFG